VSVDHLSGEDRDKLRLPFRRSEALADEKARIGAVTERMSWKAFQAGRVAYAGNVFTAADEADLHQRFDDRIEVLRADYLRKVTEDLGNIDPGTPIAWGEFRDTRRLGANLPDADIDALKIAFANHFPGPASKPKPAP
jgi:hypothetical protein